jgi:predicted lipoprotein with Yx(FWY)xxD motif
LVVFGLLLASCGDSDGDAGPDESARGTTASSSAPTASDEPSSTPATTADTDTTQPKPAAKGTVITTGDSDFGTMLFDSRTQAIYLFEPEADGTPVCYDECAEAWPPVRTDGAPRAGGGVDPALLGTVKRSDGTTQVTYNDWPLYFYAHEGPGQVLCHDVVLNGGLWLVLGPDGNARPS